MNRSLGLAVVVFLVKSAHGLEPLPEGAGLSRNFPGDRGISGHTAVLFAEDFEGSKLDDLGLRWNEVENREGEVLELIADHPEDSLGRTCLQVTATLGRNQGGHLFKRIDPIQTRVFARFYVKFAEDAPYLHHFSGLGDTTHPPIGRRAPPAGTRPETLVSVPASNRTEEEVRSRRRVDGCFTPTGTT